MNKLSRKLLLSLSAVGTLLSTQAVADGLPGEYFVTQRWRDLLSPYSPATNPALMTEANYVTVRGAFSPSLGNSFVLYEGGATIPIGLYQSVGVTMLGVTANDPIEAAEWDPNANGGQGAIVKTGKTFTDSHFRAMLSYAINPFNRLSVGVNVNMYYDDNFNDAIYGFALDLGLTYRLLNHPVLGEHLGGISFQNVISPGGEGFKFEEINQQSINTKVSWNGRMWDRRIDAGIDLDFKDFTSAASYVGKKVVEDSDSGKVVIDAADVAAALEFDFNFRLGFWLMRMFNVYGQVGTGYWGVAAGMNVPTVFGGKDFQAAYQYMSITDDDLSFTHTIYFRGEFGPHREQVYAKKMAKQAIVGPGKLYNQARQLFADGQYWDAFFLFGRIYTEYPDFFKNDWVRYFMGASQEHMEMRELANETFNETINEYSKSPAVYNARLGLMRVNYRDGNYYGVEEEYNKISTSMAADSIQQAAAYYMGATRMAEGNYADAKRFLSMVPITHSDYPFAQHSLAIANALEDNYDKTLEHLDNTIQFIPETKEQEEIINRSYVLLGFLYYEGLASSGQSLVKAVASLQSVPANSYYYEDALLGRAWVALKSANWADVMKAAGELKSKTSNIELQSEADLMISYAYMTQNTPESWKKAAQTLAGAVKAMQGYATPSAAELAGKEEKYYNDRAEYYDLALKANELAGVNQSSYVLTQIDSLKTFAVESEDKVRSFGVYKDEHSRATFFGRHAETVKSDLDYALAKAEERAGESTIIEETEKLQEIDEDILELQKQLEELQ